MTRLELYQHRPKQIHWKGPIFFILLSVVLATGYFELHQYWQGTIRIEAPQEDLGKKVIVHLPNGQEVNTYENLIVKKNGKTYYKGERNTIDLTGGTVEYKNW